MVRVPDSRLEGPGFESRCRQVDGSVLIQPPCRNLGNFVHPMLPVPSNPHCPAWKGRPTTPACKVLQSHCPNSPAAPKESMTKEAALVNQDYVQGAKNLWVKKSRRKRVRRLKIATYNVRTILSDEHIRELEEELRETRMVWDVIGVFEVRSPQICFITLQSGHLLCHLRQTTAKQE